MHSFDLDGLVEAALPYALGPARWPSDAGGVSLTWSIRSAESMPSWMHDATRDAFAAWSAVEGVTFVETTGAADVEVRFDPIDGRDGTVGETAFFYNPATGRIDGAEITMDRAEPWNAADYYNVLLHEIGHALGLEDSDAPGAVMGADYDWHGIDARLPLHSDDVAAIRALYGPMPSGSVPVPNPNPDATERGGAGDDNLFGGPGDDNLYGEGGDDYLSGRSGNDYIEGGAGNDTLFGSYGDDGLRGGAGNDDLAGSDGNDTLEGGTGNDTLFAFDGADHFIFAPGHGDDEIEFFDADEGDRIDLSGFGANAPTWAQLQAAATGSFSPTLDLTAFGGGTIELSLSFTSLSELDASHFIGLAGSTGPTTPPPGLPAPPAVPAPVPNSAPATTERGTAAADTLNGGAGNDNVYGEGGNDALLGGAGNDYIAGGAGDDRLWGQDGNDGLDGGAGADLVFGLAGNDTIAGGAGGDIILSGGGDDAIAGGAGNDGVWAEGGNDTVDGGDGVDFLAGGTGNDSLYGGAGNDYLAGEAGNDILDGGAGYDVLAGNEGNDTLHGGAEGDTFFGQEGYDRFVIRGGVNWVMDFDESTDWLRIPGIETDSELIASATQAGGHVHIAFGDGDLYLAWTTLEELSGWPIVF